MEHGTPVWHRKIAGITYGYKGTVEAGIGQIDLYGGYNLSRKQPRKKYFQYIHFILTEKTLLSEQGQSSMAMHGNTTRECWSIGGLEYWNKKEDYDVFLFCF